MEMMTAKGYSFYEVTSAMQKAIRRGDLKLAGFWAIELTMSGYAQYTWKRLLTISAEDCWGILTKEIQALYQSYELVYDAQKKAGKAKPGTARIFIAKAVVLLCMAKKSRDADHLTNLIYDRCAIDEKALDADIEAARQNMEKLPEYTFDCHTKRGRIRGKTKDDFFQEEFTALSPREPGLLDDTVKR